MMKRFPIVTFLIAACSLLICLGGDYWASLLEWDRSEIASGQWWRVATGHLCHWSGSHLLWDLAVFAVLGAILEIRRRSSIILVTGLTVLLSQFVLGVSGAFETYRGLSGIGSALFVFLSASAMLKEGPRLDAVLGGIGLLCFAGKIGFELVVGSPVFVSSLGEGIDVAYSVHAAGFAAGSLSVLRMPITWYRKTALETS